MLRKQSPKHQRKRREAEAAECRAPRVNARSDSAAIRSIMANLCHPLLLVRFDQRRGRGKNRRKCQEEAACTWAKMFRNQPRENGSRSTKHKSHQILERLRFFQRG